VEYIDHSIIILLLLFVTTT